MRGILPFKGINMSELQSEEVQAIEPEIQEPEQNTEIQNESADLATASETEHEENAGALEPEAQDAVNKRIGELTFKAKQEEREKQELQRQLDEIKAQQTQEIEPIVPPIPDYLDDDYEEKVQIRDEKIRERAAWEAKKHNEQQLMLQQQQEAQRAQLEELNKKASSYKDNATQLGIDANELKQCGEITAAYGLRNDLVMGILGDAEGPLITKALAANPAEIEKLNTMDAWSAVNYINSTIRPKAQQLKPRQTQAAKPATDLGGGISDPDAGRYPHLGNATIE